MELSEQTDVKLIKLMVRDTKSGYTGLTRSKAEKAAGNLDTLWRYYALLSSVIDKACDLYSKNSFLRDTEDEVRELLENTPVTLETEHIDISSRGLLQPEQKNTMASLQELLKFMQQSFDDTRNAFYEISHAAETIKLRLQSIRDEIANLNNTAVRIGIKDMPLFDVSGAAKIESDPLQGLAEVDALYQRLEKYKASIMSAVQDYNETVDSIKRSEDMLAELKDLLIKSEKAALESQKVFGKDKDLKPVTGQDVIESLKDWAGILKSKLSEGGLNAAKIGAQRLEHECILKLNAEKENYNIISRGYNEWLDLKGEFKSLLAKLNALKMRGISFDNSIDVLAEDLQKTLYADIVDLNSCRQLIERFRMSVKG
jgi:hypothetical protein